MRVFTLLLISFTVSGYAFVLQPKLTVTDIAELDGDELRDVSISVEMEENVAETNKGRKTLEEEKSEGLTPETTPEKKRMEEKTDEITAGFGTQGEEILEGNRGYERGREERLTPEAFSKAVEETTREAISSHDPKTQTLHSYKSWIRKEERETSSDQMQHEKDKEERESELVAGIHLQKERRGGNEDMEDIKNADLDELVDHRVVTNVTPPLSTSSPQEREEFKIPASITLITQPQSPPSSTSLNLNVLQSLPVTPTQAPLVSSRPLTSHAKATPSEVSVSTVDPGAMGSVFLLEDLLTEVLQSPGHHLNQNELEENTNLSLEDVIVKNMMFKPAQKEPETTREINTKEAEVIPKVEAATQKPKEETVDLREPHPDLKSNENNPRAKPVQAIHKPNTTQPAEKLKLVENDPKLTVKRNVTSPPQPQLPKLATKIKDVKTPSARPPKINRSSQNKTNKQSKEKRRKDNKTQKPPRKKKEEEMAPAHFPYFMDNYCPPECACYGRVVQCSDKGVDKVPYGIPYNSRYILLMNNRINSIQLDLLNEYVSMEFLVLSNNHLTDGAIEGAFEGIPALKRLYLDRNLLQSVPTDLPLSLEELRLDNNQLSVMSEDAWARCPGLLVLSLSNNSLGNGSDSLPNAVLSPLSSLRTLNLDHNHLKSVPLGLPLSIKELYFKGNLIEHFREGVFDGKSELVVLDLSSNRLTNKGLLKGSLLNATYLESLNLEGNRIKQVPRHLPSSLKTLNLEANLISSVKKAVFNTLKNLEHLGLARNKIVKVAPGAFRALPVLHQLDLCHNTLHQVPRQLPAALHSVVLTHNRIQTVPRDAFCWGNKSLSLSRLVRVQLEHNLIDMGKLDAQAFRCLRGFQVVHFY